MKVTLSNITQAPEQIFSIANDLEEVKKKYDVKRNEGESYPIIIDVKNQSSCDIKDICIKIKILLIKEDLTEFLVESAMPSFGLKRDHSLKATIFDFSGFLKARIDVVDVKCRINHENSLHRSEVKDSFLITKNDIVNQFNGYRNYEEMEICFLLQNYLQNGFGARGHLLKLIFKALDDISKNRELSYEGEKYSFNVEEIRIIKSMMQIDIISKIMMYIEDLFTMLIAIKDFNANYYKLLDKDLESSYDNKDLGDRISEFIKNEVKLTYEDWRRMLSYTEGVKTNLDNNNNNGTVAAYLKSYQNYYYKEYHEGILEIAKTFFNNRLHQLVDKTMVAAEKGE
jgi:hypothetical protein